MSIVNSGCFVLILDRTKNTLIQAEHVSLEHL